MVGAILPSGVGVRRTDFANTEPVHDAFDLFLRAGEAKADADAEGQFLLRQVVGDRA